jgi:futalosine hydrolase
MNCLVVAATAKEIAPFLKSYRENGLNARVSIDILISGIGLTATAWHLTRQLQIKKYDLVVQAGVAGCYDNSVSLGSVLMVKQDSIADQSVVEMKKLKTLFDLKLVPHNQHPYKEGWLINPYKNLLKQPGIKAVKGISVNQISTSKQMIQFYRETFNPVTESMEGAALHYICLMENIPFIQLRSISNYIGERNKKNWDMQESIENLNTSLLKIIKMINAQ